MVFAALMVASTGSVFAQYTPTFKVEMLDVTTSNAGSTQPRLKITNVGTAATSGFVVRIWVSKEEFPTQTVVVDKYYSLPAGITLSTESMPIASMPNVSAVKITYPASFSLAAGASTVVNDLQFAIHFQNWFPGVWNKSNDWSSVGIGSALTITNNVTVYTSTGALAYGLEPTVSSCLETSPTLKVEIKDNAPWDNGTSSPRIRLSNISTCKELAAGFKVRFWFSKEESPLQTIVADKWYSMPSTITLSVGDHATNPNIKFVQVSYPAGYSLLAGNATDPEGLQFGVHFLNYLGTWTKSNDYSWQGVTSAFTVTTKVTVYDNAGTLLYGIAP